MAFILSTFFVLIYCLYVIFGDKVPVKYIYILFILLVSISGFRYYVGVDYEAYKLMYDNTFSSYLTMIEPAWMLIRNCLYFINGSSTLWFLTTSIFFIVGFHLGFIKMSPSVVLSYMFLVSTFLYVESFNAIRQYVAMSILFACTSFCLDRKYYKYFICVILAMMFHNSAIIGFVFVLVNRKFPISVLLSSLIISFFVGESFLVNNIDAFLGYTKAIISFVLDTKRSYDYDLGTHDVGVSSGLFKIIYNLAALIIVFWYRKIGQQYKLFANLFILGACLYDIFYSFQEYMRLHVFFFMFGTIVFPVLVNLINNKIIRKCIVFFIMLLFFSFVLKSNWFVTYRFNFSLFS